MKPIRILIADDHQVVRAGVRALLEGVENWEIVGEAINGREAISLANQLHPDIVVLDIGMPELNGLDVARKIKQELPEVEIAILTAIDDEQLVHNVFEAGARAYVLKTEAGEQLVNALKALCEHKPFFGTKAAEIVFERYLQGGGKSKGPKLSPREREVVQLLGEGKSSKEAASALGISVRTVETHRADIMHKLDLKSFSELIRYAIRNRIIEP